MYPQIHFCGFFIKSFDRVYLELGSFAVHVGISSADIKLTDAL